MLRNIKDVPDGPGELSQYSDSLRFGWSGDRFPVTARLPHQCRRAWCPSSLLNNGYRVYFPAIKRSERGVDQPNLSGAVVKERVEVYLYSPSGPS